MSAEDILIIGAGPFGLSISAHLRALGVEHRIVGRPMDTWKTHMPVGMLLRSEPYGSDFAAPQRGFDVATYCRDRKLDYVDRLGPLSGERFLQYADWYRDELVPDVVDASVTEVARVEGGFRVTFADADPISPRKVVVATGVLPYATLPPELTGLPAELVSHTSDHHRLEGFSGRTVAVVGSGQSALETAALLHEAGALTQIVMRGAQINWLTPNPAHVSRIGHLRRPVNKLCEGWHCAVWNSPAAFRLLPRDMRATKARTVLGPAGAWWLKDRVDGVIDVLTRHQVRGAEAHGDGVRLLLAGSERASLDVDHVVAGTGFRVDVARLPFLAPSLLAGVETMKGYPEVTRSGESTVPGLYFAGAPAAFSLGPSVRFIAGTHTSARQVAASLAQRSGIVDARVPA
jgi:thioredoxin reductase